MKGFLFMGLAFVIFILTLTLVIWQPRGLGIGYSALGGAVIALLLGVVHWADVALVWNIVWDATFTFVALIIISLLLDEAGVFSWAALHMARIGQGNGRRLLPLIVLLGAVVSALFANDGAALLLTPIVIAILSRLQFNPVATLALVVATGFVADTTSLPLVISNLVNIVTANYFDISFSRYAQVMMPVNLVSLIATLLVLWLVFARSLPRNYDLNGLEAPHLAIKDPYVFRLSLPLLIVLLMAYFITAPLGIPVSVVTGVAALLLLVVAGRWWRAGKGAVLSVRQAMKNAPWQIVLFSLGMYLVVYGLGKAGLSEFGAQLLHWLASKGDLTATLGTGGLAAVVSSVMNNLPSTLMSALAIEQAQVADHTRELMIYASIIGNDLGPKFTPIGSLATLLWLHVLASKNYRISWGQYMKVGLLLTPPVLLSSLLALYFWLLLV